MFKKFFTQLFLLAIFVSVAQAAEDIVEGIIVKVVPSKKESYVLADGKKHEYYFSDNTKILAHDKEIAFDELKEGNSVKVTANKIGKRLDPITVEIKE